MRQAQPEEEAEEPSDLPGGGGLAHPVALASVVREMRGHHDAGVGPVALAHGVHVEGPGELGPREDEAAEDQAVVGSARGWTAAPESSSIRVGRTSGCSSIRWRSRSKASRHGRLGAGEVRPAVEDVAGGGAEALDVVEAVEILDLLLPGLRGRVGVGRVPGLVALHRAAHRERARSARCPVWSAASRGRGGARPRGPRGGWCGAAPAAPRGTARASSTPSASTQASKIQPTSSISRAAG